MTSGRLEFRDVSKQYAAGEELVRAVDGVTLSVGPGELIALYGPSGSGKTTLLELAAGLQRPDGGCVTFDEKDVSTLSESGLSAYLRRDVGFVYQEPGLVAGLPALDNAATKLIADGVSLHDARKRVLPLLQRVGLNKRLRHRPSQLSGGEQQRVALVRALAPKPRLILADEPTGNLDNARGRAILHDLAAYCHEQDVPGLLVTHDPDALTVADGVYVLRDGRLDERSEPGIELSKDVSAAARATLGRRA